MSYVSTPQQNKTAMDFGSQWTFLAQTNNKNNPFLVKRASDLETRSLGSRPGILRDRFIYERFMYFKMQWHLNMGLQYVQLSGYPQ